MFRDGARRRIAAARVGGASTLLRVHALGYAWSGVLGCSSGRCSQAWSSAVCAESGQQMGLGQVAAVWPACPAHASGVWRRATGTVPQSHLLHACAWIEGVICEVWCNSLRCSVCRLPPRRPKAPYLCSTRCTWHSSVLSARYSGRPHSAVRHWVSAGSLRHTTHVVCPMLARRFYQVVILCNECRMLPAHAAGMP